MTQSQYMLAGLFGLSLACGQILFKFAALQTTKTGEPLSLYNVLFTPPMILALGLYALTTLLYVVLLQQVPLSRAYMFSLAASTVVPILALWIFKEPISTRYVIGASLVIIGVALSTSS